MLSTLTPLLPAMLLAVLGSFAGWTLGSIPLTLAGAPFATLWIAGVAGVIGAVIGARCGPALWPAVVLPEVAPAFRLPSLRSALPWLAGTGVFLVAAVWFVKSGNALTLWAVMLVLAVAAFFTSRPENLPERTTSGRAPAPNLSLWAVALLALGIIALYVILHRPDADDAFYLNLPLGLQLPGAGMMVEDTMYGTPGWPILGSNYRAESLPTLTAALAWATGLSVTAVAHGVLPVIWCLTWALTLAVIGRMAVGRHWWIFAILSVLATMALAGTLQTWGTHGVARMFHGKAPLLVIVVPLIVQTVLMVHGNLVSTGRAWTLLFIFQTAALGLTANAIYIAPLTLGLSLAATFLIRPDLKRSLILLTAAAVPLLVGVWLVAVDPPVVAGHGNDVRDLSLWDMAGGKVNLGVLLVTLLAAALAARFVPGTRVLTAFVLAGLVLIVNPLLWPLFNQHVTGGLAFRVWWAIPVPMLLALGLTWAASQTPRPKLAAALVAAGLAGMAVLPSGLIGMADTSLKPSLRKLPAEADLARQIVDMAGQSMTLAPEAIAAWLPILETRPPVVFSRSLYLFHSGQVMRPEAIASRVLLADWIDGRATPTQAEVEAALSALCVKTMVLPAAMHSAIPGFEPMTEVGSYKVLKLDRPCE